MNERLRRLFERKAAAWESMRSIREAASAENRDMTGEEITAWEAAERDLQSVTGEIEREERAISVEREMRGNADPRITDPNPGQGNTPEAQARYERAFAQFLRRGVGDMEREDVAILRRGYRQFEGEERALSAGTGSAGGYTVPQGFGGRIIEALASNNAVRRAVAMSGGEPLETASGNAIPFPTNDDTGNTGELIAENAAVANTDEPTFGQKTLNAYIFSSKSVKASIALLEDDGVGLEAYLGRILGARIGRVQNTYFTTGNDTSQPNGIVTAATTVAAAAAAAIAYADLVNLTDAVPEPYRQRAVNGRSACGFMMRQSVMTAIRKLLDGQNRPLWEPSLKAGVPDLLMGYPYVINEAMATLATTNKTVLFGDFSAYQIRDVGGITVLRLNERFADNLQVGFIAYQRSDGDLLDTAAVRVLQQA
ncbi:MAG: phage major capsid protein [Desulfurellales bacterium]|nr:MAG: phage major capsid protein [Desulfurellales bacterium]